MREHTIQQTEQQIDLIAIDVDGTILTSEHRLAEGVEDAIREVRERGIEITIISGRGKLSLTPWLKRFNITAPFVAAGGAFIADPTSGHIIFQDHLERELVEPAVKFAREAGVCILFEEPEQMLAEGDAVKLAALAENTQAPLTIVNDILADTGRTPPKIFLSGDHQALVAVENRIRQCHLPLHIAFSLPYFFEITRKGVDKGSALVLLSDYLGIPVEHIAVIGDGDNDVSMFRVAGLAIAMGNASPAVQAEADLVAPINDDGGATWAIRKVIQKRLEYEG